MKRICRKCMHETALSQFVNTHHATTDVHLLQLRHSPIPRRHRDLPQRNVQRVLGCGRSEYQARVSSATEVSKAIEQGGKIGG